jgi:hypothetical protein
VTIVIEIHWTGLVLLFVLGVLVGWQWHEEWEQDLTDEDGQP